jgi:hypothetical protein
MLNPSVRGECRQIHHPDVTADGKTRASVALRALQTLWFNTGTLCNLTCANCYIESKSPQRSVGLSRDGGRRGVPRPDRIAEKLPTSEIGFTGGEPFMNPAIIDLLTASLERGYRTLVLTNAMRPMTKHADALLALRARFDSKLVLRVSVDHHRRELHEEERGRHTWLPTLRRSQVVIGQRFALNVRGRLRWGDAEASMREGFATLFASEGLSLNASDPSNSCCSPRWTDRERSGNHRRVLGHSAQETRRRNVCSSRMVVRHKGAAGPTVVSCTLLPYDRGFDLGPGSPMR